MMSINRENLFYRNSLIKIEIVSLANCQQKVVFLSLKLRQFVAPDNLSLSL